MVRQCGVCPSGVRGHFARFPPAHISAPSCRRPSAKRRRLGGLRRTTPRRRRTLLEARRRARQSIREYELIWLLQQRLRAVSWPHWRLRCMQPLHGHGMGVVRPWSLSRGDPSACHARFMCSAPPPAFYWLLCLAPPAVDLLEALDRCVCTRRACCFCLRIISHLCCFRWASSSGLVRRRFPSLASSSWS